MIGFNTIDKSPTSLPNRLRVLLRREWVLPAILLPGLLALYLVMFLRYRPYDIDNPWFLSFSYETFVEHQNADHFLYVHFPAGMDGTQLFGKLAAAIQYGVGRWTGWQQWPIAALSATAVVLSLGLWWLQLRKLGYSRQFIAVFVLANGLAEPFLSTADKFRYEFLSLLLISVGLLLTSYRKLFWGIFVAAVAVEIEPMAILGLVPVTVLAWCLCKDRTRLLVRLASALTLAALLYCILHPNIIHISSYLSQVKRTDAGAPGGFFRAYFVERVRHLPELACFVAAGAFYWNRREAIHSHYLGISALALTLVALAAPHGNVAYMIFLYPFLVGAALFGFDADRRPLLLAGLAILLLAPQYIALAYVNRGNGYRSRDIQQVSSAIDGASRQLGLPVDKLTIYGDYGLWFAHPHGYRAAAETTLAQTDDADLYLCYERPRQRKELTPASMFYCPDLRQHLPLQLLSTTSVRGTMLYLYAKKNNPSHH